MSSGRKADERSEDVTSRQVALVICPQCGGENLELIERMASDARRLRCTDCHHEWIRGLPVEKPEQSATPPRSGDPSQVIEFDGDDKGYLDWTDRNPGGYVINTTRPPSIGYLILHTATCHHITTPEHQFTSTSWTGNNYSKVCSKLRRDVFAWALDRFGAELARCQTCDP